MPHASLLLLGIAVAAVGGHLFVHGIVELARRLRMPAALVAATVAAFGTSGPEFAIAVASALDGLPELSLGDALGSNIVNTSLVLGIVALALPLPPSSRAAPREYAVALAVPLATALLLRDGMLGRWDAVALLVAFAAWLASVVREALRRRPARAAQQSGAGSLRTLGANAAGLALLVVSGELIVTGGGGVARELGIGGYAVGATVVALGTSVPELATAVVARWRQVGDVAIGTLLGSNIFNGLVIVAVPALIQPYAPAADAAMPTLAFGILSVALLVRGKGGIGRVTGAAALALYGGHIALVSGVS